MTRFSLPGGRNVPLEAGFTLGEGDDAIQYPPRATCRSLSRRYRQARIALSANAR